ncbi:MAG: hypothetical protein AB7F86_12040 [Bdellovibrionales bacterium]
MKHRNVLVLGVLLSVGLTLFQNCSGVSFTSPDAASTDGGNTGQGGGATITTSGNKTTVEIDVQTHELLSQSDFLFVVDESSSMGSILADVTAGFAALSSASYPTDTKIAVTNTAPAQYLDSANHLIDPTMAFVTGKKVEQQPGFLKLVSKSSIDSFVAANASFASKFQKSGCDLAWFSPGAVNANGDSCLVAHSQIALISTGVEAGVTALNQLVRYNSLAAQRTFRSGSLVNVIFISDTHDSGAAYYGKAKALAAMPTPAEMSALIAQTNTGIRGVKFSAIAPLPPVGDSHLDGVKYLGNLPATLADSKVSGEDLWDFSYLPFVKATGGVAMHPKNNNWATTLPDLIEETKVLRTPSIALPSPATKILSVQVNGVELAADKYHLADPKTLVIQTDGAWPQMVHVKVEYE